MSADNVTPIRAPKRKRADDNSELRLMIALGQAQAIVQLLQAAEAAGHIQVRPCDDTLDKGALNQSLWALTQELATAAKAWDDFMDGLARERRQEAQQKR